MYFLKDKHRDHSYAVNKSFTLENLFQSQKDQMTEYSS